VRTRIVATVGPATRNRESVHALAELGVDVIRVNFAHASHDDARRIIEWTREASAACARPIAVLGDLAGPKIRVGDLSEPVELAPRTTVVVAPEPIAHGAELPSTYEALASDVRPGDRILLDDGLLELKVLAVAPPRVTCEVVRGGLLRAHKGMNLPGVEVGAPALTAKDIADLEFALDQDIDYVGLSFVQRASEVADLKRRVAGRALVIAKIEKDRALADLDAVLTAADAVMVARGDLGVELPFEDVPVAQKRIVQQAILHGRPVITATQMLDSMMHNPRPTRAEVSDVANAVFDGTDAVMLSGETAAGRYPLLAVDAMSRIIAAIERTVAYSEGPKHDLPLSGRVHVGATPTEHAIAAATVEAVRRLGAPAIVTLTRSGSTTRLVSSYRPPVPIVAVSDQRKTWRQLALVWGTHPVHFEGEVTYERMLDTARAYMIDSGIAEPGQRFIVTAGVPFHVSGTTNMLRVEEL
jgi:pyruvate kinase